MLFLVFLFVSAGAQGWLGLDGHSLGPQGNVKISRSIRVTASQEHPCALRNACENELLEHIESIELYLDEHPADSQAWFDGCSWVDCNGEVCTSELNYCPCESIQLQGQIDTLTVDTATRMWCSEDSRLERFIRVSVFPEHPCVKTGDCEDKLSRLLDSIKDHLDNPREDEITGPCEGDRTGRSWADGCNWIKCCGEECMATLVHCRG